MSVDFDEQRGILTDRETGLVWMVPIAGEAWIDGERRGNVVLLSWDEATSKFGLARRFDPPIAHRPFWKTSDEALPPIGRETYDGYRFGAGLTFAGFDDWRLPTGEEWLSLVSKNDATVRGLGFGEHWLANPSNIRLDGPGAACACLSQSDGVHADERRTQRHNVRLVRSGSIFEILAI